MFEPIAEMAGEVRSVRIGGGFIASPTWVQIVADVLNSPLEILEEPQGSAFGAVVLAWLAIDMTGFILEWYNAYALTENVKRQGWKQCFRPCFCVKLILGQMIGQQTNDLCFVCAKSRKV